MWCISTTERPPSFASTKTSDSPSEVSKDCQFWRAFDQLLPVSSGNPSSGHYRDPRRSRLNCNLSVAAIVSPSTILHADANIVGDRGIASGIDLNGSCDERALNRPAAAEVLSLLRAPATSCRLGPEFCICPLVGAFDPAPTEHRRGSVH